MADGLNKVMLLGNLGADPELRMTNSGSAVLKLRIACTESYLDRNRARQERTEWVNVVIWGKRAEALNKILSKGSRIFVEGGLRTSSYDDREGNKRYRTEVNATNIILSGGPRNAGSSSRSEPRSEDSSQQSGYDGGDAGGGGSRDNGEYSDADYGTSAGDSDDNIPF